MNPPLTLVSLPLFPLPTVLFPDGRLVLRVYEQRYRVMVRFCAEQGAPFGIVPLPRSAGGGLPSTQLLQHMGTLSQVVALIPVNRQLELVQCQGRDRFRITALRQLHSGLWVADVQLLPPDPVMPIPPDLQHCARALQQVMHRLPALQAELFPDTLFTQCGWVANRWCELFPLTPELQQQLLETDSPLLRLELITDALEREGIIARPQEP